MKRMLRRSLQVAGSCALVFSIGACVDQATAKPAANRSSSQAKQSQILRGREVVIQHDCGGCHGGGSDPSAEGMAGGRDGARPGLQDRTVRCGSWCATLLQHPSSQSHAGQCERDWAGSASARSSTRCDMDCVPVRRRTWRLPASPPGREISPRILTTSRRRCRGWRGDTCPTRISGRSRHT